MPWGAVEGPEGPGAAALDGAGFTDLIKQEEFVIDEAGIAAGGGL